MIGSQDMIGGTTARRSAAGGSADSANQATFKGLNTAIACKGFPEVWVSTRHTNASATIGLRVAWYDADDTFLFAEAERTFTADANEEDGASSSKFLSGIEVYANPGAGNLRLWIRTAASAGTADIYAGLKP